MCTRITVDSPTSAPTRKRIADYDDNYYYRSIRLVEDKARIKFKGIIFWGDSIGPGHLFLLLRGFNNSNASISIFRLG